MNKKAAQNRIQKLRDEINHHRYLYHVLDKEEISEAALDSLKHELFKLERQFPELVTPDSPTQRVGGQSLEKFVKVIHSQPVLSLEDVFSFEELREWLERNQKIIPGNYDFYSELKLDGLAVVLTYKNGFLSKGATRGDGKVGEDITQNLKTIESIPLKISRNLKIKGKKIVLPEVFEVRGEVVMAKKVFEKINQEQLKLGQPVFANPRNVAAGSLRQLDPKIAAARKLECFTFEIITDIGQKTHEEVHEILSALGFKTNPHNEFCFNLAAVQKYLIKWEIARLKLAYQTDGVVVVVNNLILEKKLGYVGKTQRWMAAYKFPAEQAVTIVEDIKIQVGRIGTLTPVAVLKPVRLAGTIVSRATLHNQDEIKRLDIRIGDTVIVQKAGDIIPDIIQVLPKLRTGQEKPFVMPKKCPICLSLVIRPEGEVNYYCSNLKCFAVEKEKIVHFVSRKAFDIEGLGPKIIEQLINEGLIGSAADLFKLTAGDLEPLARFAEKSAGNLVEALAKSKKISLAKFIYSLGIRHVGEETAIALAEQFGSVAKIKKTSLAELAEVEDIGEETAKSLRDYFNSAATIQFLQDLEKAGIKPFFVKTDKSAKLNGQVFVLTGGLDNFTRDEAKNLIRKNGGEISESVSQKTDYVVAGTDSGSKYDKAKKLGIRILTEKDFAELLK